MKDGTIVPQAGCWQGTVEANGAVVAAMPFQEPVAALGWMAYQIKAFTDDGGRAYPVTFRIDGPAFLVPPVTIPASYEAVCMAELEREAIARQYEYEPEPEDDMIETGWTQDLSAFIVGA